MENFSAREVGHQYVTNLLERENQGEWVWYHCYHYFSKVRYQKLTATDYNMLSLHLSVYLAEEKMYHGSSFILQNSYKSHRPGIELICSPKYHQLSGIKIVELMKPNNLALLFELVEKLKVIYHELRKATYQRSGKSEPISPVSQSLLTKILLGTLGCVPAFDRQATTVFKQVGIEPQSFSKQCLLSIAEFHQKESKAFQELAGSLAVGHIDLPEMKLVDIMLQWKA